MERRSASVEAWLYDACGRRARLFEPESAALFDWRTAMRATRVKRATGETAIALPRDLQRQQ
jgi:hypothetical protein